MMVTYIDYFEELHFFDSYFKKFWFKKNNLIIPCINVGVSEHPLNKSVKMKYVNFSYVLFEEIVEISSGTPELEMIFNKQKGHFNKYYFGGDYLKIMHHIECEILSRNAKWILPDNYELSSEMWIPIETPSFKKNIDEEKVEHFFSNIDFF